jgi:endonuclease YncB( thermonuclease family)
MKKDLNFLEFNYTRLLADLSAIQKKTQNQIDQRASSILLQGYWQMGERLCREEVIRNYQRNDSGFILARLAEGLDMEYSLLTRIIKLYKLWPDKDVLASYPALSWSHFKKLMAIPDEKKRDFYLRESQKNQWNKQELIYRVKNQYYESIQTQPASARPVLFRRQEKLYLYAGSVTKVVDGDTLVVSADLGFHVKIDVRIRLRGINTQELKPGRPDKEMSPAVMAKEFLKERLRHVEIIIFQTFKVDLYGRYVADIYYLPGERDKETVFERGRYLNQDLVDAGLAQIV